MNEKCSGHGVRVGRGLGRFGEDEEQAYVDQGREGRVFWHHYEHEKQD